MVVVYPLNSRFKETYFTAKLLFIFILLSLLLSVSVSIIFKYTYGAITMSICLPFIDPTDTQLIINLIVWFTAVTQMTTSIGILIMHCLLLIKLR